MQAVWGSALAVFCPGPLMAPEALGLRILPIARLPALASPVPFPRRFPWSGLIISAGRGGLLCGE